MKHKKRRCLLRHRRFLCFILRGMPLSEIAINNLFNEYLIYVCFLFTCFKKKWRQIRFILRGPSQKSLSKL